MGAAFAFVFDAVDGAHGRVDAFSCDLDFKLLAGFNAVSQAAQLGYEFVMGVDFLDVAFGFHDSE